MVFSVGPQAVRFRRQIERMPMRMRQGMRIGDSMALNLRWEAGGVKWKGNARFKNVTGGQRSVGNIPGGGTSDPEVLEGGGGIHDVTDVKRAEFGIASRCAVEPHGVNDVLDVFRGAGPKCDSPFPVIESGGGGDEL